MTLPDRIPCTRTWKNGHVQGIAIDKRLGHIYYCFTTLLVKTDLDGQVLGTVGNLAGHMGCLTIDPERRRLYGSLELKHDKIGQGVIARNGGWDPNQADSFYLVAFDIDRIDRMDMDAERDGVMRAVYLRDVAEDYANADPLGALSHRYGCSGIDGIGLGPVFGAPPESHKRLMIAYGIYGQPELAGNDHQVILQYDPEIVDRFGAPLCQATPHHMGPQGCEARYFVYTGNTTYGVQNLEYDPYTGNWLAAVYAGKKPEFPNYSLFFINGRIPAAEAELQGRAGEHGSLLTLTEGAERVGAITGSRFPYGQTGIYACGDGTLYFSQDQHDRATDSFGTTLVRYRYAPDAPGGFATVEPTPR